MEQKQNKLYTYLPLGIMKNKIYWMEIRRMKERKRPKIRMKGERAHTHTHTNTILCMHVCVCGIMFEGWRPHWLARRARRAPQTPRPKKHVGYLSCPYLLPVNGFQWLCLPLHAQQTTECYLTLSHIHAHSSRTFGVRLRCAVCKNCGIFDCFISFALFEFQVRANDTPELLS